MPDEKEAIPTTSEVTILGSGTCVPSLERRASSILISTGKTKILFDSGPGTMNRLLEAGTEIYDIPFICYTHFHPDHTGELASFLFANKYPDTEKRQIPLTLIAGNGFKLFFNKLRDLYGDWITLTPGMLNISELDTKARDAIQYDRFKIVSVPVAHNPESIGYRVETADGLTIALSGDTDVCDELVELAESADLFICESAMPNDLKVKGHLTPSLAGEIASRAGVKKLVLTHFYPECDRVDIENECRKTYNGKIFLAHDLMRIRLTKEL
ncbi:MAG: MBL fold metallo-hydrolase [Desulfobacterales bacterium]|nr:MBL fold metallo-hydrolase [Desulfobacterales bacterium]